MNLLKISTCALCLGTVLGVSSMAMEQNGEKCQQNVSEQVQNLETNREKEEKSERYLKFYNDLITKGKLEEAEAKKQAEMFEEELNKGKSFIYAQYYSMLRVVRKLDLEKAILQTELFEKEFKVDKNFKKADYYANAMISRNLKAIRLARLEEEYKACIDDKKSIEKILKIIKREIESGRSCFYTDEYICQLKRGEADARKGAKILEEELMNGRSIDYARSYSSLILDKQPERDARKWSEMLDNELKAGRNYDCARMYVSLIMNKQSEENARKAVEILEVEKESLRCCNEFQDLYAQFYLMARTEWDQPKEIAEEVAHVIVEELISGKSQLYARIYARQIVVNKEKEAIARKKVSLILEEFEDEEDDKNFTEIYAQAVVDWNIPRRVAMKVACKTIEEIELGNPRLYALLYSRFFLFDHNSDGLARRKAEVAYNEIMDGKNDFYAIRYAELKTDGIPEDEARIKTEAFMKIYQSGKRYYYAKKYSELIVDGESKEAAAKEAEMYDRFMERRGYYNLY